MAWDSEVPKIGDTYAVIIGGGTPAQRLSDEAALIERQAQEYRALAASRRDEAERFDEMAVQVQAQADLFKAAAESLA